MPRTKYPDLTKELVQKEFLLSSENQPCPKSRTPHIEKTRRYIADDRASKLEKGKRFIVTVHTQISAFHRGTKGLLNNRPTGSNGHIYSHIDRYKRGIVPLTRYVGD